MQPQRITFITLLATATTSFALNFLALFPTSLALAQTPTDLKPGHIFSEDEIRKFKLPDFEEIEDRLREAKERQRKADDRFFEDLRQQQEFQEEQRQRRQQDSQESLSDLLQNPITSKAEADRLFQQGLQQHKDGKFEAAIKLWQQALRIYQQTGVREAFPQESRRQEAETLNNLGAAYRSLGQHKQAIKFLQQSLGIAREIVNRPLEALALINLGDAYRSLGQYQQSIEALQQSLDIAQAINNPQDKASALLLLGLNYLELEQYQRAIERFQQALTVARKANNTKLEAAALKGLLGTYLSLGQYQQITEIAQQAINTARKTGDSSLEAWAQLSIGSAYSALQQHQQAIAPLQLALKLSQKTKERAIELSALDRLGNAYYSLAQSQQAIEFYQRALKIARESKNREAEATALTQLGNAYVLAGERQQQAIGFQQQALEIARAVGKTDVEVQALLGLSLTYSSLGQIQQANERQQMALKTAQTSDRADSKIVALASLGSSYLVLGQYQQSIQSLQQALKIAQEANSPSLEATVLTAMGGTYVFLGQYQRVIEIHQRVLKIGQNAEFPLLEALALLNLGSAYNSLENYPQAIQFHQQALKIAKNFPVLESTVLNSLGFSYFKQEKYPQAIKFYQQATNIAREVGLPNPATLNNLGATYFTIGQNQQAIKSLQQSLASARESKVRGAEADTLDSLGMVLLNTKKFSEAEPLLFEAIEILESLRTGLSDVNQVSVFDTQTNAYNNLQFVLAAQNKVDKALEIAERGRARALVDLLSRRLPTANTKIGTTDKQSVTPTSPAIAQIKQVAREQNATLVEYSVIENDIKNDIVGEKIFIWVVKPTGEVAFRSVDLKSLDASLSDLVVGSRDSIGVRGRGLAVVPTSGVSQVNQLKQLHQLLIQPIADLLPTDPNARVVFIPQEALFLVPFPALQDKSGKYLIEKHTILTAPAIQALDLTRQQRQQVSGKGALVVGNPTMPSVSLKVGEPPEKLKNLPAAEKEAKAIAPLLQTQAITGGKATKATVLQRMPQARIIHLATHGLLDDSKELGVPGAIALAPSGKDDGLLTANEIQDMKLNAELIVLSACDTGRGRITGDGVIGLSRSLISAGAPSVIVSLWSVPDAPTASLMTQFYRNLQQNPDKAQALRQAMLTTLKQHPSPRDWAAFTLIGEAK